MKHRVTKCYEDICLRPLCVEDLENLRIWRNDSENSKYIRKLPHITSEAQREWFAKEELDDTSMTFAIDVDNRLVGSIALYDLSDNSAEFGRLMIGEAKGKGVGTKATKAVLRIAFEDLSLQKVRAEVSVDNIAALKIYVRVGFCIDDHRFNPDAGMDEYLISLDRRRFEALSSLC